MPLLKTRIDSSARTTLVRRRPARIACLSAAIAAALLQTPPAHSAGPDSEPRARMLLAAAPQTFEPNRGQTAGRAEFLSRGPNYTFLLSPTGTSMRMASSGAKRQASVEMSLVGASRRAKAEPGDPQSGTSNYFFGNDPKRWRTDIPHYGRVTYREAYPGIDIAYYGNQSQLEYDLVLSPGADPRRIRLKFRGADDLRIDSNGDLVLRAAGGEIRQRKPTVYQKSGDHMAAVEGGYVLLGGGMVGFRLGTYDSRAALTIDPVLVFSSYLGGSGSDAAYRLAVDSSNNVYVSGSTTSADFPVQNAYRGTLPGASAVFLTKVSATGQIVYSTYLGGSGVDYGSGLAVDGSGNVYLTGQTTSTNFPTAGAIQTTMKGGSDAFITKLNAAGNALVYSTFLGGTGDDFGFGIGVDAVGNAYISGYTSSTDFPTHNPIQSTYGGSNDGFVAAINAAGSAIVYSTYLGGNGGDYANHLTVDAAGNAYVAGDTTSTNLPTLNAFQSTKSSGTDGFVAKIAPSGGLSFLTYLGGNGNEAVRDARPDASGNVWVTGETTSTNFPTVLPIQSSNGGGFDGFVAKLSPSGTALLYSTYIGGSGDDKPNGLVLDSTGNIYISGWTSSPNFPLVGAVQSTYGGGSDAFVLELSSTGSTILFSTYLGGSGFDAGWYLGVDSQNNAYVTGETAGGLPTASPFQANFAGGGNDSFVAKISTCAISLSPTSQNYGSGAAGGSFLVTTTSQCSWSATSNNSWITLTGATSGTGNGSVAYSLAANSGSSPQVGTVSVSGQTFTVNQAASTVTLTSINPASGSAGASVPVTLTGTNFIAGATVNVTGTGISVSNVVTVSSTQITSTFTIAANATPGNYSVSVSTTNGSSGPVTFAVIPPAPTLASISPASGNEGASVPVTLTGTNFVAGATVSVANPGVTVSGVTVVSATKITATFAIAANAATGAANVTVTTSAGTSGAVSFIVTVAGPTLTGISPLSGTQGTSVPVTLTGTNFIAGATVSIANPGVTISGVTVVSATQITATFVIATGATLGSANVTVTTANGTSGAVGFTVLAPVVFTPIRVNSGGPAYTDPLGQVWSADYGWTNGYEWSNTGTVYSTNTPTLYLSENHGATSGPPLTYTFAVPNGNYVVNLKFAEIWFTTTGQRVFNVTINGQTVLTNFDCVAQAGAAFTAVDRAFPVAVTGGQIVIQLLPVVSNPKISAIEVLAAAPSTPTITSISPASGAPGSSIPVTITGANLGADVVVSAGSNIQVSNVTVLSATQVTATFAIASGAPLGAANPTVTTAGGTSAPGSFTIGSAAPTLTGIAPSSGTTGSSVPVTLTGTNFVSGATVSVANAGVTVSGVTVVSATQITATFAIAANATLGAANVTVTTPSGTTGAVTFTIAVAAPTLTGISPLSGTQGTSVPVTLTGTNFITGSTVSIANAGVTVSGVTVANATQITATFTIAIGATLGSANVTVTTANGTTGAVGFTVLAPVTFTPIRVNSGGPGYTDPLGQVWSADYGWTNGYEWSTTGTVYSTNTPTLYLSENHGPAPGGGNPLTYTFSVPNGNYIVNLKFAEIWFTTTGQRVFNVTINGQTVLSNFDVVAQAGAAFTAVDRAFPVAVTTGQIVIQLPPVVSNPKISGIEILSAAPPTPSITSISPASGSPGSSVPVTITGANLGADMVVSAGSNIQVSNVTVLSATQVTATFAIASGAPLGAANPTVTTAGGTSAPGSFTVGSPAPALTAVAPASGAAGSSVPVTLTGTNFISGATVSVANAGVTVSGVTVVSATQITATFAIAANATVGASNVTITTSGGTSGAVSFTVNTPGPNLTAVSPNSGTQGASVPVTLTGTNFTSGATVSVANAGVTVSGVTVVSATQITATFTIAANATAGASNVTVTTSAGTSGAVSFTVNTPGPNLTSVSPNSGTRGTSIPVTLTGTNFIAGASVSVANAGVTVSSVSVVSVTQITATFTIAASATLGSANVTVTTSAGTSGAVSFTVNTPGPNLTSVSPNSGTRGTSIPVTLTGTNFIAGASVSVANAGVTVSSVSVVSATQITATFTIAASAALGSANVTVTTSGGTSGAVSFTVNSPAPTLTSVSPNSGTQGASVPVTLTGTNFISGATVSVANSGVTVSGVTVVSATQITATFTIAANATAGASNVTVTTSAGTSGAVSFTVNTTGPTLTAASPASGTQGTSVPVTLTGTNFISGATVSVANAGVTVSSVSVVSATQITATFTIAASATLGSANVTVTTSAGTSGAVAFTVLAPVAFTPIRVNSGGPAYTDPLGQVWSADYGWTNGYEWSTTGTMYSTNTPTLYLSENHGPSSGPPLTYTFTVPNGNYLVNLKFAEIWFTSAGQRIFNVTINGQTVLSTFDVFAQAGAAFTAVDRAFPVTVTGGQIVIQLPPVVSNPKISAIEILAAAPAAPALSAISPAVGTHGKSVSVTLTGTNLQADAVVSAGPNIKVGSVVVSSATKITATFAIASGAPAGGTSVTVTNEGGTSNPVTFTIQ